MKKLKYEIPQTTRFQIEMEGAFCAASGESVKTDKVNVEIENQVGGDDFTINVWDSSMNNNL